MRKKFAFVLMAICIQMLQGQNYVLKGHIVNSEKEGIPFSVIFINNAEPIVSDINGVFLYESSSSQELNITIQNIGFRDLTESIKLSNDTTTKLFFLPENAIVLGEVKVYAEEDLEKPGTTLLSSQMTEHVQMSSLSDIMDYLPGSNFTTPDLKEAKYFAVRSIFPIMNEYIGNSVIIDGMEYSNNSNMQTYSITTDLKPNIKSDFSMGIDLRDINPDDYDRIEVIKGISSPDMGSFSSGAIMLETKNNPHKIEAGLKRDVALTLASISRGARINKNSILTGGFSYTSSYTNPPIPNSKYKRISLFSTISNQVDFGGTKLFTRLNLQGIKSLNDEKFDKQLNSAGEFFSDTQTHLRGVVNSELKLSSELVDKINFTGGFDYDYQMMKFAFQRGNAKVEGYPVSDIEGENYGIFIPAKQITKGNIEGKPFHTYIKVTATKELFYNFFRFTLKSGYEYNFEKNYGNGLSFDRTKPLLISGNNVRPYRFDTLTSLLSNAAFFNLQTLLHF